MGRKRTAKRRTAADNEALQDSDDAGQTKDGATREETPVTAPSDPSGAADSPAEGDAPPAKKRRRRGRRGGRRSPSAKKKEAEGEQAPADEAPPPEEGAEPEAAPAPKKKRRSRRKPRSSSKKKAQEPTDEAPQAVEATPTDEAPEAEPLSELPPAAPDGEADTTAQPAAKSKRRRSRGRKKRAPGAAPTEKLGRGREMLINVIPGEECRIAVTLDGKLEELFIERASSESHVGNIYKGRVTNVEPSIQAAFVDFGLQRNGFLHISDLVPQYFPGHDGEAEDIGRKTPHRNRPPIQKCLRRGQEVIVQITKEGIGTKGPTLNTYISLPGRFLVMMPGMSRLGVSRKIEDEEDRKKMREVLAQLNPPKSMGFILRTAGLKRTKRELQRDLNYLTRLWKTVTDRIKSERAPATLYQESDLAIRTVRDTLETDVERVVIDDEATAQKVRDFLTVAMPRAAERVLVYNDREPLFYRSGIEEEIEKLHSRFVPLPCGGSLVIDSTEALVAIDVNSGKYREQRDAEETARRTNLEAAEEIARQLRLRDLGGVIICDFIDMRLDKHNREVERALREALKRHKERARILRMSRFGIIEMTRQRTRPSISRSIYQDCSHCKGSGMVKTPESAALDAMRMVQLAVQRDAIDQIEVRVSLDVAFELQNRKREAIYELETATGKAVVVKGTVGFAPDQLEFHCQDARGRPVRFP